MLSSLSLNSLCSQRSGFPDWRSQRKNNPGFGRSAGLRLQLLLTSTEAPWPKSPLSQCSLVWKAGTQKTWSIEGYFLGGASVTLGSLYVPETQICQLEARPWKTHQNTTPYCSYWGGTGQSRIFGAGALFGLSTAVPKPKMDFLSL